jgi:L-fuculose-phosphate aldolase
VSAPGERSRDEAGAAIARVCRRLYERGLVAGPDGNVSVRLSDGSILVTPAGMSKVDVQASDLVVVDPNGRVLAGHGRPSSELALHLRAYSRRSDVHAVVHAHPPIATGFSVAGESFEAPVLPEVILQMGAVPLVPYVTPGTDALADSCGPYIDRYDAFLMANHGATTLGATLAVAHQRMESLEHAARILLAARTLGRVNALSASDVAALRRPREEPR